MGKLIIASDHGGFELKEHIKVILKKRAISLIDFGPSNNSSVDYPDFGIKVGKAISEGKYNRGILICGTGIGMSIVANKFPNVRGTLCHNKFTARFSKEHNNSNLLILGGRVIKKECVEDIVNTWLDTAFKGDRHERRLNKIKELEKNIIKGESK